MSKKTLSVFMVMLIIAAGGSFYGGIKYDQVKNKNTRGAGFANLSGEDRQAGMQQFGASIGEGAQMQNRAGAGANGGMVAGEILSKDDKSAAIKLRDGGSKIVFFSETTQIIKLDAGSIEDLKTGENISIFGSANSDGSISAQTIQIRPETRPLESPEN